MLDRFFSLFADPEPQETFGEGDYRLAAAALLVHVVVSDGRVQPAEQAALERVLSGSFDLGLADTRRLIAAAEGAEQGAVDLTAFTDVLVRRLEPAERARIVRMMWDLALADGRADEIEEAVVERAAALLGVDWPGG